MLSSLLDVPPGPDTEGALVNPIPAPTEPPESSLEVALAAKQRSKYGERGSSCLCAAVPAALVQLRLPEHGAELGLVPTVPHPARGLLQQVPVHSWNPAARGAGEQLHSPV